jgi:hypothetical protein
MATDHSVVVSTPVVGVRKCSLANERTGEWRQDAFIWRGQAELKWDDKTLAVVAMAHSEAKERPEADVATWAILLNHGAASLVESERLTAFAENDVGGHLPAEKLPAGEAGMTVSVSDAYFKQLLQEHELDQLARKSFEYAVQRLEVFARNPGNSNDGGSMFAYLERCLDAGYLDTMTGWYREKMLGIREYMTDLAKRKNRNHDGYRRAQEYINSNLFSFAPPSAWLQRPPTINPAKIRGDLDAGP